MTRDEVKEKFSQTMEFVETYLRDVRQNFPFSDKEKNKLTFEVRFFNGISNTHSHGTERHGY